MDVIGSDSFSEMLAQKLEARHIRIEKREFPDGEICPRLLASPGSNVLLAERMALPLYPNRYLAEILLTLKGLKAMNVENISMVMPYFIYSRQDRSFRPGEPFSAKHVLELLADSGVSNFFTVSSHMERFKPRLTAPASMSARNLDGYSILGGHLKGLGLRAPIIIGPDMSISMAAERVASMLGAEHLMIEKSRDIETGGLTAEDVNRDFKGRDVVIVDDIISSGGTMLKAIRLAENCYCGRVVIAAVHAVQQRGIDLLKKHAWRVIATDTICTPVSSISVIGKVAEAIKDEGITRIGSRNSRDSGTSSYDKQNKWKEGKREGKEDYNKFEKYDYAKSTKSKESGKSDDEGISPEPAEGAFSMFD